MQTDRFSPSPLQQLQHPVFDKKNIRLYIKRDDLLGGDIQGNKWRKLKYNLLHAKAANIRTIITFGGVWSNHLYATAAACRMFGFRSVGIVRGYAHLPLTDTLRYATENGMELVFADKAVYQQKNDASYIAAIQQKYPDSIVIPEGGTTPLSLRGVAEMMDEITQEITPTLIATAVGTGGTLAGIVAALRPSQRALGFSSLKGTDTITDTVSRLAQKPDATFALNTDYHFGGYARVTPELFAFIRQFKDDFGIQLEPIYNGKMMYGLMDIIQHTDQLNNETIVAIHTGGLQGLAGYKKWLE